MGATELGQRQGILSKPADAATLLCIRRESCRSRNVNAPVTGFAANMSLHVTTVSDSSAPPDEACYRIYREYASRHLIICYLLQAAHGQFQENAT